MTQIQRPRLIPLLILGALALTLLGGPSPATGNTQAPAPESPQFEPGVILVAFNPDSDTVAMATTARDAVLRTYGGTWVDTISGIDVDIVSVAEGRELDVIRELSRDPRVRYAEPNYIYHAFAAPNDPNFYKQWAYPKIEAPTAWDIVTGATTITIAIIDSGIDMAHPDLAAKIVPGYDYIDDDSIPNDQNGHGTHVAGIAAAVTNNTVGVAGTSWGARIMPLRVLDTEGNGTASDAASAIGWAQFQGADIINLSLGGPTSSQTLRNAVDLAHNDGILIVAAMGNYNTSTAYYPAAYANVLAVSATNESDSRAPYSNYGAHNDIAAPGGAMSYYGQTTGIYSTMPTYDVYLTTQYSYLKNYDYLQGTSQAAPFVSGLAALIWSVSPGLTPDQVQQAIQTTAIDLGTAGWDNYYGWGRINARAAIESVLVLSAPTLSPINNPELGGTYWVDWSDTFYATSYTLEEADNPLFLSPTVRYTGLPSTALVTGRPSGVWYYRVRGERVSAGKVSPWSTTQSVQVGLTTPVLQPIVNDGSSTYAVAWQAVPGATGYRLQESSDLAFTAPVIRDLGNTTSFLATGQVGGTWYYRVQAYNSSGESNWSVVQTTTVRPAAPTLAPAVLVPPDAYTLTWSAATGAIGYRLQESPDPAFTTSVTRYLGTSTTYAITGQPGGMWYYRVEAYNQAGFGPSSNTRSIAVTTSPVAAPVLHPIDYNNGPAHYTVAWTEILTATYTLEGSRSIYFETPTLAYSGPFTSYVAIDQDPGPWHYRVRAHTSSGNSPWSNIQSVSVFVYLPLVTRDGAAR